MVLFWDSWKSEIDIFYGCVFIHLMFAIANVDFFWNNSLSLVSGSEFFPLTTIRHGWVLFIWVDYMGYNNGYWSEILKCTIYTYLLNWTTPTEELILLCLVVKRVIISQFQIGVWFLNAKIVTRSRPCMISVHSSPPFQNGKLLRTY